MRILRPRKTEAFPLTTAPTHTFRFELKHTLILAGPMVLTQLGQISLGFVDTVMVGRLGTAALAGVGLGNMGFFSLNIMAIGILMAVGPMVSQAFGAGDHVSVGRSARQGLWLALCLWLPIFLLLSNFAPVLRLLGQDEETIRLAAGYLKAIRWGVLPFLWFVVLRNFVESVSRPRPVTAIVMIAIVLNVAANYAFMFGKFGFPALGLVGTGWASTVVYWMMFLSLVVFIQGIPDLRSFAVFSKLGKPDGEYFRNLFRIGWPIGLTIGIEYWLFGIAVLFMGKIGPDAIAAHQIAIQCAAFTFMVPLGLGMASAVRVGQAVGRHDAEGVRLAGYVGIGLSATFMFGTALLFWTLPRQIVGLYLDLNLAENATVVDLAVSLLTIAAVFQLFDGVQATASGALRGLKDTRVPLYISAVSYLAIGMTVSYSFGFLLGGGPQGVWWGLVLALCVASILMTWRFARQTKAPLVVPAPAVTKKP